MSDTHMADQRMPEARARPACLLCAYTGGANAVFDEIMAYVADNAHRVHLNELATHVRTALREQLGVDMTREQVREHFLSHECEQRVVLNHVLRDLVEIIAVAKSNCVVVSEEGMQSMDPKNTGVYIDAVKQLMCIYKQLDHVGRARA
jgi:hypothetical protein